MNDTIDLIIIIVLLILAGIGFFFSFRRKKETEIKFSWEQYGLKNIITAIGDEINKILNTNVTELNLNETETKKRIKQKAVLREAVRNCCLGDAGKKEYVKSYIKLLLQEVLFIDEGSINKIMPFHQPEKLKSHERFLILYYILSARYGNKVFGYLCDCEWNIEKEKEDGIHYEVWEDDVLKIFEKHYRELSFFEKLEITAQLIYQELYGLGVVDILTFDDSIDNISGGVGGISEYDYNYLEEMMENGQTRNNCYDTVFIMYHGKQIRQAYLSFGSKEGLIRVVKNIYRYDAPYMLTAGNGYVVANRQDNTRVTVTRPSVSASWAFFLRKFKSVKYELGLLLSGEGKELAEEVLRWIIYANETFTISGSPAAGKTTMLKALVPCIDPRLSIRMAESVFETMFQNLMPDRNIQVMQERGKVKILDIINAFKKMDTDITILGEITEPEMAAAFVQIAQSGGKMTMCTLHHETTQKLIEYMRNALMVYYDLKDASVAEQQVVSVIHFDIHLTKDALGQRYIERITEIIPKEKPVYEGGENTEECMKLFFKFFAQNSVWKPYDTREILIYDTENKRYLIKNSISDIGLERISKKIKKEEYVKFCSLFEKAEREGGEEAG